MIHNEKLLQEIVDKAVCDLSGKASPIVKDCMRQYAEHISDTPILSAVPSERMLKTLKMCYCKHHLNDPNIGWDELSNELMTTLCEIMGDKEFNTWLKKRGIAG